MLASFLSLLLLLQAGTPLRGEATVTGRIVSRDGKPEANIRVMVFEAEERSGNDMVALAETDASGLYRLEKVPPGRYIIAAGFVEQPSYYPGVVERASARVITVGAAAVVEGIDFANVASFVVKGRLKVLDPQQLRPGRGTQVRLLAGRFGNVQYAQIDAEGRFAFSHVSPGQYGAMVNPGVMMVPAHVVVTDRDITDLELVVPLTKSVAGQVVIEGDGRKPTRFQFAFDSASPEVARMNASASLNLRDQSFRVTLPVGQLGNVLPSPPEPAVAYTVKSFTYGTVDLLKDPLTIVAADTDEFRVVLEVK